MLLVTVCVNVFNREDTLKECLDSIINQTYKNLEIIIVDDCSTDNSLSIIEDYCIKDNRIRLLKNDQNLGGARSTEKAYDLATGYYLSTVDSDDYIELNCIERCVREIKDYGLIYTYCGQFGDCSGLNNRASYEYSKEALLNFFMVFHFRMFKTELWHQVKYLTVEWFCYDYDLVLKLSEVCEFKLLPEILYWWRRHSDQLTCNNNIDKIKEEYYTCRKAARIRRGLL